MIWCDLDGTLVHTAPLPPGGQPARVPWVDFIIGREEFRGAVRPGAVDFLRALRAIGAVRLLTFSRRAYAEEICRRFELGFAPHEIVAQPDWWGSFLSQQPPRRAPASTAVEVLVANESDAMNAAKISWLGPRAKLVLVPDFDGFRNDVFGAEWQRYIEAVVTALDDAAGHQSKT